MKFSWWTFALQAINFLILIWLLRRFLFKPVTAIVARRKEEIARGMTEAAAEKQKALDMQRDVQAQRAGIEAERQKAIEEQRAQLAAERKKLIDEAHADAEKIRTQAAAQLNEERTAATQELFSQTIDLAVKLAERLLRELTFPSIEHAFMTRVLDYLDRLPPPERTALVSHLDQTPMVVTTAHPLDAREEAEWREQLAKRIGRAAGITFNIDPALIAGAEIALPSAILRFNWRDALTVAAKAINRNEHPG
ncbi:MAG: F0F1 ATP synthase subunit B [Candidatus Binatus sp.]|uniref:F0F1 ATP synthase subunit B n=1 Tax=Candidatus Binatus sp. TaxID=2811406 RepID=UPI003BB1AB77